MTGHPDAMTATNVTVHMSGRAILSDLCVGIPAGQLLAVIGPNGAGKTTLLRALAGLISLDEGQIAVSIGDAPAVALTALTPSQRARQIAYLPQDRALHWALTVERVVALGRLARRTAVAGETQADRAAIANAMEIMGITHLAGRSALEISGGERARVMIARALAQDTPVLLADEPTAGLDLAHQIGLLQHLRAITKAGRTVVVALHDLSLAARHGDQVLLLKAGRIDAHGPPDAVLDAATIAKAYNVRVALPVIEGVRVVVPLSRITPD